MPNFLCYNRSHGYSFRCDGGNNNYFVNDIEPKKANYMTITKEEESFKIEFKTQPNEKGEVEDTGTDVFMISVRIRTSGCRYAPFHIVFMRMFNRLIELPNFEVEDTKTDSIVLKKELSKKEV